MAPLMIAGTALNAIGQIANGRQAAAIGNRNSAILNEQARQTDIATIGREGIARDRSAQSLSQQRVAMLQNGLDPSSGSALFATSQSIRDSEMDALTLRYEGLMQSRDLRMQADLAKWRGKAARNQSYLSAAGSIVQGAGSYLQLTKAPTSTPGFGGVGSSPY